MVVERFGVYLCPLDPTFGAEMRKTRPCVVLSPDEMNRLVRTVIIAPLTSTRSKFPFRVDCHFRGQPGQIALDQIRSRDKRLFLKHLGQLDAIIVDRLMQTLNAIFKHSAY
jgi:mRNA interferase MazF